MKTMGICVTCGHTGIQGDDCRICKPKTDATFDSLKTAILRYGQEQHLAGLQEAITELRALRITVEGHNPNEVATSMVLHGLDDKIRLFEERVDVLQKSIGG